MQVKILKKNDIEEKCKTRKLYEKYFDIGKDDFINYYYDVIIKRNEVIVILDDAGDVISMIHLNPYEYNVSGQFFNIHYLVAVATDEKHRGKGYMKMLLDATINYLKENGEPFCMIVPDDNDLMNMYRKFGFEVVGRFNIDKFSKVGYDIYPVRSDEFNKLMEKEKYFLDLETKDYIEDLKSKVIMINILNIDKMPYKNKDEFKSKSIYVCQEV